MINGIPSGSCICSVCFIEKDNTEFSFYRERKTKDGFRLRVNTNCKTCSKIRGKERLVLKKITKNSKPPEFGNPCDCCGKPVHRNWQLDHCHETGQFRGWLCKTCNTGLGLLGDNVGSVRKALDYLLKSENKVI